MRMDVSSSLGGLCSFLQSFSSRIFMLEPESAIIVSHVSPIFTLKSEVFCLVSMHTMDAYSEGVFVIAVAEIFFESSQVSSLSATAFRFWFTSAYQLEMSKLTAVVTFLLICRTACLATLMWV